MKLIHTRIMYIYIYFNATREKKVWHWSIASVSFHVNGDRARFGVSASFLIISRGNNNDYTGDRIWRQYAPVTIGGCDILWVDGFIWGIGTVSSTPALVPIQSNSLQANSAVTLRHAALCCRIMSSQPATGLKLPLK